MITREKSSGEYTFIPTRNLFQCNVCEKMRCNSTTFNHRENDQKL